MTINERWRNNCKLNSYKLLGPAKQESINWLAAFLLYAVDKARKQGTGVRFKKGANPSGFCPGIQLADQDLLFGTICNLSLNSIFYSVSLFLTTILIRLIY